MKKFFITIISALFIYGLNAQSLKKGDFSKLEKGCSFTVKIDYSDALLQKDTEEGFANTEDQWEASGKNEVLEYFLAGLDEDGEDYTFIKANKSDYTLTFHVKELYVTRKIKTKCLTKGSVSISGNGVDILIDGFEDETTNFGTTIYLFKCGMKDMGEIVARYIDRSIKKKK